MDLGPLTNTSRSVVDNFKVSRYNVASRNIYERGTCTGANRRLRFEVVNIGIMQHVFVIKKNDAINMRNYRHGLIFKIWWNFRFDGFVMKDIA
jgi:hypothetical protein